MRILDSIQNKISSNYIIDSTIKLKNGSILIHAKYKEDLIKKLRKVNKDAHERPIYLIATKMKGMTKIDWIPYSYDGLELESIEYNKDEDILIIRGCDVNGVYESFWDYKKPLYEFKREYFNETIFYPLEKEDSYNENRGYRKYRI